MHRFILVLRFTRWTLLLLVAGCAVDELLLNNPHDPSSPTFVPRAPLLAVHPDILTDGLVLTWVSTSDYDERIQVERRPYTGEYSIIAEVEPDVLRFIDTVGVVTNVEYAYRLGAVGKPGIPAYSLEKPGLQTFTSPEDLSISPLSGMGIRLLWNDDNAFPRSFVVERASDNDAYAEIAVVPGTSERRLDDSGISPTTQYRYRMKGMTSRNSSPYSDEFKIGFLPSGMISLRSIPLGGSIVKVAFSTEDDRVLGGASYALYSYVTGGSVLDRNVLADFYNYPAVNAIAVGPNSLGASGGLAGITIWDLRENTIERSFATSFPVRDIEFSVDGGVIAVATAGGVLRYQVSGGGGLGSLSTDSSWCVVYSPDGTFVAAGSTKGATLWNLPSNTERFTLSPGGTVRSISASADGTRIACWSTDGTVSIWSTSSGSLIGRWPSSTTQGTVGLNPDGTMVAWSEGGSTMVNLSTTEGVLVHSFSGHGSTPTDVVFSNSGRMIASCSPDGTIRLWSLGEHWWLVP